MFKKFDPILSLIDDKGRVVSESFTGHLGYRAPTAGTYALSVGDKEFRGGADFGYRLSVGPIPIITSVFPLGIARGTERAVRIRGVNLGFPDGIDVKMTAPATAELGSRILLPKIGELTPLGVASVVVGEFPATTDTALTVPGTFDGVLANPAAYADQAKAALLTQQRADLAKALGKDEEDWLALSGEFELAMAG